jgi:RNA polymerase sigma-70 factor (ECF subfamily)
VNTIVNNEPELLRRLSAGEEMAFKELYEQYASSLISFASARLDSLEEAHDIVQDIFVHLWQDKENINIHLSFRAYLFAATRYRIIDHIRKNGTRKKYAEQIGRMPIHIEEEAENKLFEKELRERLDEAIHQLPPRTREVFCLSRFEHLSAKEIAKRLDLSEQTVKNQLTTALSKLRVLLGKASFVLWWL